MNKIFLKIWFAIFLITPFLAIVEAQEISVEARSGAFFHSSKRFREIYGNVGVSYQLEASAHLCHCLEGWTNFSWFSRDKKSEGCSSRASIANISLGIRFPYRFCEGFIAYIGIGPSFSEIWLKNRSECCREKVSKLAVGGILKTGLYYFFNHCVFIDVFVDYLYQPVNFHKHVDIGGVLPGAGVGIKF